MSSFRTLLLAIVGSVLLLSRTAVGDPPVDSFGDRLPPNAIARLGSARLKHGQPVSGLAFSPDGKTLLSIGWGESSLSTIRLWNAADGKEKYSIGQGFASCVAFAPDGRSIAAGGTMGVVRLWQAETGHRLLNLTGDSGAVSAVIFSPDGKRLFTAGGSGKLHVWDIGNGEEIRSFTGHEGEALAIALSADGKILASTGADGTLRVWEVESGKESLKIALSRATDGLAMAPNGKTLYAYEDDKVRRWKVGKELPPLNAGDKPVQRMALSGDARTLATSVNGSIQIWNVDTDKIIGRITQPAGDVAALAISPDGKTVVTAEGNGNLHLWDAATSKERFAAQGHTDAVAAAAYSPQGRIVATASKDGTVRLWDAADGKPLRTCDGEHLRPLSLRFSPDEKILTAQGEGGEKRTWMVATGRELPSAHKVEDVEPTSHGKPMADETVRAFGPKRWWLAIGRADGLVSILETATGKTVRFLSGHSGSVTALAFSPDGRLLASGGADHLVRVWETATGAELLAQTGHSGAVLAVAFSPDGRRLLSGGADGVGLIWDLTHGPDGDAAHKETLTTSELTKRWADLLSEDGPTANGALWDLASAPEQSVPFIHDQLRPLFGADAQRAAKLIVDLDDDSFEVRERASAGLAAMGPTIAQMLNHAYADTQSSEARHRLQELLNKLKETVPWQRERVRVLRALSVLEQSRAPAAREVLEATAKSAVEPEVKQAAREALERLAALSKP